jgi:hypothetical protein
MRSYNADDLERFAAFRTQRALFRPRNCKPGNSKCWVDYGPPAIDGRGLCRGCRNKPLGERCFGVIVTFPDYPNAG